MMLVDDPNSVIEAENAGVNYIFYDLEVINKRERQRGRNTVISNNSIENVKEMKAALTKAELLVRINPIHANTELEIEKVINDGADIIMLPMIVDADDVRKFVELVDGRARTILLLETAQSLVRLSEIVDVDGVDEIFIGLNDLHISLGLDFMFELLSGGIIEYMSETIRKKNIPFGFGGIAKLGDGLLPAEVILGEHYRLGSSSVILSRTFKNSLDDSSSLKREITKVRCFEEELKSWTDNQYAENNELVKEKVKLILQKI